MMLAEPFCEMIDPPTRLTGLVNLVSVEDKGRKRSDRRGMKTSSCRNIVLLYIQQTNS